MEMRNIKNTDVHGKYVLLRDDFNVPIVDGKITEPFRIDASMETIKYLTNNGARVVICSHLGRPNGDNNKSLSLRPIAEYMNIIDRRVFINRSNEMFSILMSKT